MIVKSISFDNSEIIKSILKLHVPNGKIDCDPTYSKGIFYKNNGITPPTYKFDLIPQTEDTIQADCRNLPLENNSIDCLMFDPPFLATTGKSLGKADGNNIISNRFGVYRNEKELFEFYIAAMKEFYRVLTDKGVLIFKCQDKVSSNIQYMSHCLIYNMAVEIGFYPKDLFILLAKSRLVAEWQTKNQKHSRKYHSYFWVFEKGNAKLEKVTMLCEVNGNGC